MFQVDTTTGTVESSGLDITFPSLPTFDKLTGSGRGLPAPNWLITVENSSSDTLFLEFTTAPTAASLKGFTGGSIAGSFSLDTQGNYKIVGGTITPAPEPSSLVLFASGMLMLGLTRRFRKKVGHPLSA
jgi:hypothetical protein